MILEVTCHMCRTKHTLDIPKEDILVWQEGALIQNAMPYLSVETRELLISGTCNDCFDKLFGEPVKATETS